MFKRKQSRSIICKIFFEDINNFCLYNPFRLSRGLIFLFSKYYNLYRLDFHKQSKIFYKRLIIKTNKFRHKKYFTKIRLIKKKFLLFFAFRTFKQLSYFFNKLYLQKSIFLFKFFLNLLELRLDFICYRLRFVFSISEARQFIENFGYFLDFEKFYDFNKIVKVGVLIQFAINQKLILYNRFYFFWFNEFMYSNKLVNLNFFNKIILLKKFKKKINFFRLFLYRKYKFFFSVQKTNLYIKKKIKNKFFLDKIKVKIKNFKQICLTFFDIFFIIYIFMLLYIYILFYNFISFKNLINVINFQNCVFFYKFVFMFTNFNIFNLKKKKKAIVPIISDLFYYSISYFVNLIKFKSLKLKGKSLKKLHIRQYSNILNKKIFYKFSILVSNQKKYLKFIKLLKYLSFYKINFTNLMDIILIDSHPKLIDIDLLIKNKFKFLSYRLKFFLSKRYRKKIYRVFNASKNFVINQEFKFIQLFNFLYKFYNKLYKSFFLKRNQLYFFSFSKKVHAGFKYIYSDNKKLFREKSNKLFRLFYFFKKIKFISNFINNYQFNLQTLFLRFKVRYKLIKKKIKRLWKKYKFKMNFFKFFYISQSIEFYKYLYCLKRKNIFNFKYSFLQNTWLMSFSFLLLKKKNNKVFYYSKSCNKLIFYFSKNKKYFKRLFKHLRKRFKKFYKNRKLFIRFFKKRTLRRRSAYISNLNLSLKLLKKKLFKNFNFKLFFKRQYDRHQRVRRALEKIKQNRMRSVQKFHKNRQNFNHESGFSSNGQLKKKNTFDYAGRFDSTIKVK